MKWILPSLLLPMMATAIQLMTSSGSGFDANDASAMAFQEQLAWLGHEPGDFLTPGRELIASCDGPTETYYFEVAIRIVPDTHNGNCNVPDQVLLGNELNQLLDENGVGEAGVDEGTVIFLAGVCPRPSKAEAERRRLAYLRKSGFMWRGGGGCRYCLWDNSDQRNLLEVAEQQRKLQNWFADTFAPPMEATLENAIRTEIVPNHQHCLGPNPTIDVELIQVLLGELNNRCEDGRIIESLESLNLGDVPLQKDNCGGCVSLDFSTSPGDTQINKGDWIREQWKTAHGLKISAAGGYSPSSQARIFDTGDAVCVNVDGSRDFGSPNQSCQNQSGIGIGSGGVEGEAGENCDPVGSKYIRLLFAFRSRAGIS